MPHLPKFIPTESNIFLRPLVPADFPAFERTLNEVQRTCMGSSRAFFDWIIGQYEKADIINGLICFGIFEKLPKESEAPLSDKPTSDEPKSGALLGTAGLGRHDDLHEPEIFYYLLEEYRGKGHATMAAKALTKWAFENYPIDYLIGTVEVSNDKSRAVLERSGFEFVENRTLLVHVEGKKYDFMYFRKYRGD